MNKLTLTYTTTVWKKWAQSTTTYRLQRDKPKHQTNIHIQIASDYNFNKHGKDGKDNNNAIN